MLPEWYRHSPSSGNLYREAPDAFIWRYGFGKKDDKNGKMAAGNAVEFAVAQVLLGVCPEPKMIELALAEFDKQMQGEATPERDDVEPLCKNALEGLRAIDRPLLTYQSAHRLQPGEKFGLNYAVSAYTDYGFEHLTVDCKVTWRLPSEPKFSHICQLGTYHALTGKPQALLYVTPKKRTRMEIPEADLKRGFATMMASWLCIENLARRFNRPEDAVSVLPHNPDSFYWSDAARKEAAAVWNIAA
jgi:hypothetical protein